MDKLKLYTTATIIWALIILTLTLLPGKSYPDMTLLSYDKAGHAGIFGIQVYLFAKTLFYLNKSVTFCMVWGLIIVTIYGAAIEIVQQFIPDRSMEWLDLIANVSGVFVGIGAFYVTIRQKKR